MARTASRTAGPGDVGHNMAVAAITNLIAPAAAFASAPILARALGVEARGEVGAATSPLLLMTALATVGLPAAVTVLTAKRPEIARFALAHATLLVGVSGVIGTLVSILLAPFLAGGSMEIAHLISITSLAIVPTLLIAVLRGAASGHHEWRLVNREKYITAFVRLGGVIALWLAGVLTVETSIAAIALSPIIGGLAYLNIGKLSVPHAGGVKSRTISGDLLGFGTRVWVGSLSGILLSRLDQVLIIPLSNTQQLGYYVTAVSVAEVALVVNNAVRDVILASDAAQADTAKLTMSARVSFLVSIIIGAVLVGSMWVWFPWLFGQEFQPAVAVSSVLVLAGTIGVPGSVAGAGLSSRGRPGLRSSALVIAVVINVLALLVLVPPMGAMGAAIATLIGNIVSANLSITFFCRLSKTNPLDLYLIRPSDVRVLIAVSKRVLKRQPK
ncbi:oligosaccharide flippase family protein [Subtercola endophyticus]|uniref:oligosaccharide flippase family protein n=1 Tax=Subtercola endophyticus TaxID=2895559 RepID=UPI001E3412FD|nr:oligosaccharide flippase family protein [Subtercola endophyticus]UFS57862.1 oligosaccharide flippase family protein [Subtercola endophyticus]